MLPAPGHVAHQRNLPFQPGSSPYCPVGDTEIGCGSHEGDRLLLADECESYHSVSLAPFKPRCASKKCSRPGGYGRALTFDGVSTPARHRCCIARLWICLREPYRGGSVDLAPLRLIQREAVWNTVGDIGARSIREFGLSSATDARGSDVCATSASPAPGSLPTCRGDPCPWWKSDSPGRTRIVEFWPTSPA